MNFPKLIKYIIKKEQFRYLTNISVFSLHAKNLLRYLKFFIFSQGGVNVKSARFWKQLQWLSPPLRLPVAELVQDLTAPQLPAFFKNFHRPYLGKTWSQPPLRMEADISTQSAQASIEKNTVPCIPAGPKSCLVRKMAWSWYSAWSGSRRCCVLAHRHTCSRLRDGLPRSIRLTDCRGKGTRENTLEDNTAFPPNKAPFFFTWKKTHH